MPCLDITLDGHLLIAGGQTTGLGVDLSTTRRFERGRWIPYIPATAVRGAVRIQLEALLRGARRDATGPYPLDAGGAGEPAGDPVSRLFGYSGREGERSGSKEGLLRFSDALPVDPDRAVRSLRVRTGVEIDDATASVEEQKLFSRELLELPGEPLIFRASLQIDQEAKAGDVEALRNAVTATFSLGAGKSTGGGEVSIAWRNEAEAVKHRVTGASREATCARVICTLLEPAHFGDGGPRGNHHGTRTYVPGATLRGAIAWALLRHTDTVAEDEGFRALFLAPDAASFGDALLTADGDRPAVRPATLLERREVKIFEDVLARELARSEVNSRLGREGRYLRADVRHLRTDPQPARPAARLVRRVRTRVSIDRHTGTSAEGKLFSIEQIEPWLTTSEGDDVPRPATFNSSIEGLTPPAAELLARLAKVPVYVGAGRNHGMGRVALEIRFEDGTDAALDAMEASVLRLTEAVAGYHREMAAGCGLEPDPDADSRLYLALVARSDFLLAAGVTHPLAPWQELAGEPARTFLTTDLSGGYNQMPDGSSAPLKTLRAAVGAGSVFVYRVERSRLRDLLRDAQPALRRGIGERRSSGCGRFDLFEEMTT